MIDLVKIVFSGPHNDLGGGAPEVLWGAATGSQEGIPTFEVRNSPFYVKGVSYLDEVRARHMPETNATYEFVDVIRRGGHSTYRIIQESSDEAFGRWWRGLKRLGCTYESSSGNGFGLYAVDVPPTADIYKAYALMTAAEEAGVWQFEEGHCGHPERPSNRAIH